MIVAVNYSVIMTIVIMLSIVILIVGAPKIELDFVSDCADLKLLNNWIDSKKWI
jgi:hypothetical protein